MKLSKIKYSGIGLLLIVLMIFGCRRKSDDFYDDISISSNKKPLAMVFAHSEIETSGDFAQPILNRIDDGKVSGIPSGRVNFLTLYPSVSDPEYNVTAEQFKFLHDSQGDNTFETYPSFWSNATNFSVDTNAFYESLRGELSTSPDAGIGIRLILENGVLSIYTKVQYFKDISYNRLLGLYVYEKASVHNQTTSSGEEPSHLVKNRLHSAVTSTLGAQLNGSVSKDSEGQYLHQFNFTGEISTSNLGVMAVLFKGEDGKPVEVINSVTN
jgi:hypothetical protein